MNLFVKKLLAKYVIYIEIMGYALVLLFIAGLFALSNIKAEDEYVNLSGKYEIKSYLIKFDYPQYIINQMTDSISIVQSKDPLLEITSDQKFIADRIILYNLENQVKTARKASQKNLENKLSQIVMDIEKKTYPNLKISTVRSPLAGKYIMFPRKTDSISENEVIAGVFDFDKSLIRVSEFPVDQRMKKKLKLNQTGTAVITLGAAESVDLPLILQTVTNNEAVFSCTQISDDIALKLAKYISSLSEEVPLKANIKVLVGWKSWMRLIWR